MTEKEIIALALQVRTAQKTYFAQRNSVNLEASKKLEKQLDQALINYYNPSLGL